MAESLPGGVYQGPDGSYHDANGQPVSKAQVRAFEEQQGERQQQLADLERQIQLQNPTTAQALAQLAQSVRTAGAEVSPARQPAPRTAGTAKRDDESEIK